MARVIGDAGGEPKIDQREFTALEDLDRNALCFIGFSVADLDTDLVPGCSIPKGPRQQLSKRIRELLLDDDRGARFLRRSHGVLSRGILQPSHLHAELNPCIRQQAEHEHQDARDQNGPRREQEIADRFPLAAE